VSWALPFSSHSRVAHRSHPSRLPYGALRAALTGPVCDALQHRSTKRKMAGLKMTASHCCEANKDCGVDKTS
jgi:hypothetical protein